MIKINNRYYRETNRQYYRVDVPPGKNTAGNKTGKKAEKPPVYDGGFCKGLNCFLPAGIDSGDLIVALILLLLYYESHDEEFLIILAVLVFSTLS